jgi:hypothetical protein
MNTKRVRVAVLEKLKTDLTPSTGVTPDPALERTLAADHSRSRWVGM